MTSATESSTAILRRLLDERGVEWKSVDFIEPNAETQWGNNCYTDYPELPPYLTISNCTPEQAIAATLNAPINEATGKPFDFNKLADRLDGDKDAMLESETCCYVWSLASNGWADWTCDSCGNVVNLDVHVEFDYNYCPKCGKAVKR